MTDNEQDPSDAHEQGRRAEGTGRFEPPIEQREEGGDKPPDSTAPSESISGLDASGKELYPGLEKVYWDWHAEKYKKPPIKKQIDTTTPSRVWWVENPETLPPTDPSHLCVVCQHIDFKYLLNSPLRQMLETVPLSSLEQIVQKKECAFCRLVTHTITVAFDEEKLPFEIDGKLVMCELKILPMGTSLTGPRQLLVYLNVFPKEKSVIGSTDHLIYGMTGGQLQDSDTMKGKSISLSRTSLSTIKRWYLTCLNGKCGGTYFPTPTDSLPRGFRLVDVQRMCIVEGNNDSRYLALSYVWGGSKTLLNTTDTKVDLQTEAGLLNRLRELPETVKHAIYLVIGAGAVGLAIARKLAERDGTSTLLLERHGAVGTETSSRNSEVIHAGIYYGPTSLKTRLCLKGKQMMYDLCEKQSIPYRNSKKWILAQNAEQHEGLVKTHDFAKSIGVPIQFISLDEARVREPDVLAREAVLESPTTGIVDSHAYMSYLESDFQSKGGDLACHTNVKSVEPLDSGFQGWKILTRSPSSPEITSVTADVIINSAGLAAVPLSNSILPPSRHITPYYAKGSYYSYSAPMPRPKILVYPAPTSGAAGLGTHLTIDMTGAIRFGPDVEWVDDPTDLSVNESRLPAALEEIEFYMPSIRKEKVQLGYSGIRPKLGKGGAVWKGNGDGFLDFVIRKEEGYEGFVNLLGIESPGLTSSLAIAEMVDDLLYK